MTKMIRTKKFKVSTKQIDRKTKYQKKQTHRLALFLLIMLPLIFTSCGGITISEKGAINTIESQGSCPSNFKKIPAPLSRVISQAMSAVTKNLVSIVASEVAKKSTGPASDVRLTSFSLTMPNPPSSKNNSNTLGFLTKMSIYATGKGGAPRILLLQARKISANATSISLTPTTANIQAYINQGMTTEVSLGIRACPKSDIKVQPAFSARISL